MFVICCSTCTRNLNAVAMPTTIANIVFFWFRDVEVCKLLCLVNRLLVSYISSVLISFGFAHTSVDLFDFNKINSVTGAYEKPCETHEQFNLFKQLFCSRRCSFFCVCAVGAVVFDRAYNTPALAHAHQILYLN